MTVEPHGETTIAGEDDDLGDPTEGDSVRPTLVVAWCAEEPERIGQVLAFDTRAVAELGRGAGASAWAPRVELVRQRPGCGEAMPPLQLRRVSRRQLQIRARASGRGFAVRNVGRCPMRINGTACDDGVLELGDALELVGQVVLACVERPCELPPMPDLHASQLPAFGSADAFGIVGESPAAWTLRRRIAFVAGRNGHVLVTGPSGAGKELVARAIHSLSSRTTGPLVARNAVTLPDGLVDAELFGNVAGYPNPGMRGRPGLVGRAHEGTLFLDEIGELPDTLQAHLLRVLDRDGGYHRLGDPEERRSDLRLIAATNRAPPNLKHDLAARLTLRIDVPGLDTRREDVPLLVSHLLERIACEDAGLRARYFAEDERGPRPRLTTRLVTALVRHGYTLHVRELEGILWHALGSSPADRIDLTADVRRALGSADGSASETEAAEISDGSPTKAAELDPAHVQAVLDQFSGVQEQAWRALGLKNRFALIRLIRKHGLVVRRR